jgi:hypothetical protein
VPDRPPPFQRTRYFAEKVADRPGHADITPETTTATMQSPDHEAVQADGRIRRWRWFAERGRWLRVALLDDGATVHNAFGTADFGDDKRVAAGALLRRDRHDGGSATGTISSVRTDARRTAEITGNCLLKHRKFPPA